MKLEIPNPPTELELPFSREAIDWKMPVQFRFHQLRDVSAAAERAGYRIFRLKVEAGGYQAQFQRKPTIQRNQNTRCHHIDGR